MQYHARALAANGVDVDLVGYEGTALSRRDRRERRIRVHRIVPSTLRLHKSVSGFAYVLAAIPDACRLSFRLWRTLRALPRPDLVLMQNPPQFPTLAVTWWSLRRRGRAVRDRLAQPRLHGAAPASRAAGTRPCAWRAGSSGGMPGGSTATSASRARSPRFSKAASACTTRASSTIGRPRCSSRCRAPSGNSSARRCSPGSASAATVVGFIVCPTSWTEDEDFDVAIDAVLRLEERIRGWEASVPSRRFPDLVDSRHRRRHAARRVRAAVRRPAGAADPAALAMARARGLSRAWSAAPISACACIGRHRGWTFR